ncbi:MAG: Hsp20/alpha crystallin family protein [Sulfitobacter sp.]|nr:Hsp20/alpha crystallin family protein [Sulfitobacter sp.]
MNRLLEQFRTGFPSLDTALPERFGADMFPAIDVLETEEAIEVSAEVPGVKEDDLEASISGSTLVLKGEKSSDHREDEDNYHLVERRFGSFRRQIPLGFTPEEESVEASFVDGVLKVKITKPAAAKSSVQKINISRK